MTLQQKRLKHLLNYNPKTGIFTWRIRKMGSRVGQLAGEITNEGYCRIMVDRKRYLAHRLAWLWFYGKEPKGQIDHINRIKNDNRIKNLREATNSQNQINCGPRKTSTSGFKGVTKSRKHWKSGFRINGKYVHIGVFDTALDAAMAYETISQKMRGEFAK